MIRLTVFWVAVSVIAVYTWKDWFRGLCGLILMVGILEMPDVPKSIFDIDGLNFFNVLLLNVAVAWIIARYKENLKSDLPQHLTILAVIYLAIVLIGFARLYVDRTNMIETRAGIIKEYFVNTLKWALPGVMLYDGCRTRQRTVLALLSVMGIYLFLGLMVIKVMPIRSALLSGIELQRLALKLLVSRVGLHRVTLSMMLAGASWAVLAMRGLTKDMRVKMLLVLGSIVVVYAQSLTAGRAGYISWAAIGLVLCLLRWRGYLFVAPVIVLLVVLLVPSVAERALEGITKSAYSSQITVNDYDLTAGRIVIWPLVIDKIKHGMWIGFGRMAMWRTGIVAYASTVLSEDFGHPHNAYLEWLLDNGIAGFVPVMLFYVVVLFHAARLFCDRRDGIFMAAGGTCAALVLGLLGASIGSQSFYPIEGTVGMWCAIGIALRVSTNRSLALAKLEATRTFVTGSLRPVPFGMARPAASTVTLSELLWPPSDAMFPPPPKGTWAARQRLRPTTPFARPGPAQAPANAAAATRAASIVPATRAASPVPARQPVAAAAQRAGSSQRPAPNPAPRFIFSDRQASKR
jgi:O-antigen ligase